MPTGHHPRAASRSRVPGKSAARAATGCLIALALGLGLLTGCASGTAATATGVAAAGGGTSSSGSSTQTAIPTEDVVSSVHTDAALNAELPAAIRTRGTLVLGTSRATGTSGLPHAGQTPDGRTVGLDVDLRDAVAKVLGVRWDIQYGTFPTVIPGVQNGRFDVGQDNFGVTRAREQVVDFATYLDDGQSFLGSRTLTTDKVNTLTDLCGYTVATSPGSTFQQILTAGASRCAAAGRSPYHVQYFTDTAPIFLGLANGKVDIYFGPTLSLTYDARHLPGTKYLGQISTTPVGFVTAKNSPLAKALGDAVNQLIADGAYARIFAKWGVPGTALSTSLVDPPAAF
ncbi:transporter substrate-binding domain-containing protein [Streptacidiphilus jiangxiensis]|uniref:Polar amino acid transport system substrate-binding protein n=1 Tax=Streptacidiphilus jiangxiensis TaxID=235985 RepID=A0A1H7QWK7_STRJI|nr:transporter substrate-binding domain-containing protein [Streptacidiphilus jiangxiensis]SEL52381.1 polar amino acid transport system substrate-binding protein [Streptacidiphilus jiangxiensis]